MHGPGIAESNLLVLSLQAYVQQLETSRIRLQQVEHELQRARSQVRSSPNSQTRLMTYLNASDPSSYHSEL